MSDGPCAEATPGPGIAALFDRAAQDYDAERPKLVPCFEAFYGAAVEAVGPLAPGARLLDLGAGTGLLAAMIAVSRPGLDVTLVDLSAEMLNLAPGRFAAAGLSEPQLVIGDYAVAMPEGPFEAIVSALSIHHLEDAGKTQVFAVVAERLTSGGVFVNAEQVLGETAETEAMLDAGWEAAALAKGASCESIAKARARMAHDRCATATANLEMMAGAGLSTPRLTFREGRFAVLVAGAKRSALGQRA